MKVYVVTLVGYDEWYIWTTEESAPRKWMETLMPTSYKIPRLLLEKPC